MVWVISKWRVSSSDNLACIEAFILCPCTWDFAEETDGPHCCPTCTWEASPSFPFYPALGPFIASTGSFIQLLLLYVEILIGPATKPQVLLWWVIPSLHRYNNLMSGPAASQWNLSGLKRQYLAFIVSMNRISDHQWTYFSLLLVPFFVTYGILGGNRKQFWLEFSRLPLYWVN